MSADVVVAGLSFAIWAYLVLGHGGFWCASERDDRNEPAEPQEWPRIVAVIPARNEADMLPQSLGSLLAQDYPGELSVILVDDSSDDGTADVARRIAGSEARLTVLAGAPLPAGWTGKLWAVDQGVRAALSREARPDYLLLTDADIGYSRDALRRTVARAKAGGFVLTSLMAQLRCDSLAERALIPAFVFFFEMLYPFAWVNDRRRATAAAAGGSMLVEAGALEKAGGIGAIRAALIDDCALGARMKAHGPIWLGLTHRVTSLRPYPNLSDIRRMVARSAYAQLKFSPLLLAGTVAGLSLVYIAPPLLAFFGAGPARALAVSAWGLMTLAFLPILRFYRLSPVWAPALPAIAATYMTFTIDGAIQHWQGRGGMWKGRAQAIAGKG
jgi:hopene-associated glycosyltransferase HpnB